jgi:hypothetical protein
MTTFNEKTSMRAPRHCAAVIAALVQEYILEGYT